MRVRTQLIICMAIFGLALLVIAVSAIDTYNQVAWLHGQENLANSVELKANDIGYLSNDYLLYHETPQLDRWQSEYASISDDLANLTVTDADQLALTNEIRKDQIDLKTVFDDVVSETDVRGNDTPDTAYVQVAWSRISVQTQGMVFDASQLSGMLYDEESRARLAEYLLTMALLGTFTVFLLVSYWLIYRRTLRSVAGLQAGARAVGSGNLDYAVADNGKDEFGEVSRAFDGMTARLKEVMASRADLEREIAERKRAETAREEARAQAELYLDLMSHDITNMHQIAIGYLEHARESPAIGAESRFLIDRPLKAIRRGVTLIDNVMKLQKVRAGDMGKGAVALDAVLQSVADEYRDETGVQIAFDNAAGPCVVEANELLHDVFANLVGNAIKHSRGKSVDITIRSEAVSDEGRTFYRVSVADNGPGIPDDAKAKVFDRMQRGDTGASGMGLGLYLVRSLVESYRGRVCVEDRVAGDYTQGSRFVVLLPAAK